MTRGLKSLSVSTDLAYIQIFHYTQTFIFSYCFMLVGVIVVLGPIMGARQQYTLDEKPVHNGDGYLCTC